MKDEAIEAFLKALAELSDFPHLYAGVGQLKRHTTDGGNHGSETQATNAHNQSRHSSS